MAGLSSRFFKAGYDVPKYQLKLPNGRTMFEWAVLSFERYFKTEFFIFIVRDVYNSAAFVNEMAEKLGIINFEIVQLERETIGQAETVYLGLVNSKKIEQLRSDPIYIFNIDSCRHDFIKPDWVDSCDGYLEVFKGNGDHWSFIEIDSENKVIKTTEKVRISDLCSDGLYYFKCVQIFIDLVEHALNTNLLFKGELYIAPLYNILIEKGSNICYELIEPSLIEFCGTPKEYIDISNKLLAVNS